MTSSNQKKLARKRDKIGSVRRRLIFGSSSVLPTTSKNEEQVINTGFGNSNEVFEKQRVELERLNAERDDYPLLPEILANPGFPYGKNLDRDGYYDENGPNDVQRELQIDLGMDHFNRRLPAGRPIVEMYDYYFEGIRFSFSEEQGFNDVGPAYGSGAGLNYCDNFYCDEYCELPDYGTGWGTADEDECGGSQGKGSWFEYDAFVGSSTLIDPEQRAATAQLAQVKGKAVKEASSDEY